MFQGCWDKRKGITEFDSDVVQGPVVDTRPKASVLLSHEKETRSSRGRRRADVALFKSLFYVLLHGPLFWE